MNGASVNVPIALDFGNLLIIALGAAIAFIWRTLTEKIDNGDRLCESASRERCKRLEEKLGTLETAFLSLPQRMDGFAEQLKRIELMLANHYTTKEEMRAEVSEKVERFGSVEQMLARVLELRADPPRSGAQRQKR